MSLTPTQQAQLDEMSMAEKVAVLLLQLGEDITASIFTHLDMQSQKYPNI